MKFVKGVITGMIISAACMAACAEYTMGNRKVMKEGKKMIKKLGII